MIRRGICPLTTVTGNGEEALSLHAGQHVVTRLLPADHALTLFSLLMRRFMGWTMLGSNQLRGVSGSPKPPCLLGLRDLRSRQIRSDCYPKCYPLPVKPLPDGSPMSAMTGYTDRQRRLRQLGLIGPDGELTARGEEIAEELYHPTYWPEDSALEQPEPYPDSELY